MAADSPPTDTARRRVPVDRRPRAADTATLDTAGARLPVDREPRPAAWVRRVLGVVATWSAAWWLVLAILIAPALPGHWRTMGAAAALLAFGPLFFLGRAL